MINLPIIGHILKESSINPKRVYGIWEFEKCASVHLVPNIFLATSSHSPWVCRGHNELPVVHQPGTSCGFSKFAYAGLCL